MTAVGTLTLLVAQKTFLLRDPNSLEIIWLFFMAQTIMQFHLLKDTAVFFYLFTIFDRGHGKRSQELLFHLHLHLHHHPQPFSQNFMKNQRFLLRSLRTPLGILQGSFRVCFEFFRSSFGDFLGFLWCSFFGVPSEFLRRSS